MATTNHPALASSNAAKSAQARRLLAKQEAERGSVRFMNAFRVKP